MGCIPEHKYGWPLDKYFPHTWHKPLWWNTGTPARICTQNWNCGSENMIWPPMSLCPKNLWCFRPPIKDMTANALSCVNQLTSFLEGCWMGFGNPAITWFNMCFCQICRNWCWSFVTDCCSMNAGWAWFSVFINKWFWERSLFSSMEPLSLVIACWYSIKGSRPFSVSRKWIVEIFFRNLWATDSTDHLNRHSFWIQNYMLLISLLQH